MEERIPLGGEGRALGLRQPLSRTASRRRRRRGEWRDPGQGWRRAAHQAATRAATGGIGATAAGGVGSLAHLGVHALRDRLDELWERLDDQARRIVALAKVQTLVEAQRHGRFERGGGGVVVVEEGERQVRRLREGGHGAGAARF